MSRITRPAGVTDAEAAAHDEMMRILEADPRTSGNAPRPPWLVERVLADARKARR